MTFHLQLFPFLRCQSCGSSCVSAASLSLAPNLLYYSVSAPSSFPTLAPPLLPSVSWVPAWSPSPPAPRYHSARAPAQAPALDWTHPAAARTNRCTSRTGEFLMGLSETLQMEFQREFSTPRRMVSRMLCQSVWQVSIVVLPMLSSWLLLAPPQELQVPVYPCRPPRHCSVGLPGEQRTSSRS